MWGPGQHWHLSLLSQCCSLEKQSNNANVIDSTHACWTIHFYKLKKTFKYHHFNMPWWTNRLISELKRYEQGFNLLLPGCCKHENTLAVGRRLNEPTSNLHTNESRKCFERPTYSGLICIRGVKANAQAWSFSHKDRCRPSSLLQKVSSMLMQILDISTSIPWNLNRKKSTFQPKLSF